jgi:hypothetical protein
VSKVRDIFNRLRQIDGAKQQWAYEHNQTNDVVVTKEDLATLFRGWSDKRYPDAWFKPLAGELYTINTLCKSPEAVLTRKVERLPKGTVLRFGTNLNEEIILPNKITGANAGGLRGLPMRHLGPPASLRSCEKMSCL